MARQQPLFVNAVPAQRSGKQSLALRAQGGRPLNKKQQAFNRLVASVERLRARLENDKQRFDDALVFHAQHLRPRVERAIAIRKDVVRALGPFLDDRRLKRGERQDLRAMLGEQFDEILTQGGSLDDDLRALFEEVHGADLAELEQEEMNEARSAMEAMFADLGLNVDLSDFRPGMSEDEFAATSAKMADEIRRQSEEVHSRNGPGRRKTKRDLHEREHIHRNEELRKASIGTIYRQLAKVLHPDLEPDPERRQRKSAVMQELTAAYAHGDLHTLLRLELEWIHREEPDVARLTDEKLGAYNQLLKEQVAELKASLFELPYHPRYQPLVQDAGPYGLRVQIDGVAAAHGLDELIRNLAGALARLQTEQALQEVRGAIQERRRASRSWRRS